MSNVKRERFAMTPIALLNDVCEKKISPDAAFFYALISAYWGGYDSVFPRQSLMVEVSGFSLAKVKRLLKELNASGWILSERQARVHGNNIYYICNEPFKKPAQDKLATKLDKLREQKA